MDELCGIFSPPFVGFSKTTQFAQQRSSVEKTIYDFGASFSFSATLCFSVQHTHLLALGSVPSSASLIARHDSVYTLVFWISLSLPLAPGIYGLRTHYYFGSSQTRLIRDNEHYSLSSFFSLISYTYIHPSILCTWGRKGFSYIAYLPYFWLSSLTFSLTNPLFLAFLCNPFLNILDAATLRGCSLHR